MSESIDISHRGHGEFWAALSEAQKGDRIVYHVGDFCGGVHRRDAMKAEVERLVFLFCKRVGKSQFAYMAVKR